MSLEPGANTDALRDRRKGCMFAAIVTIAAWALIIAAGAALWWIVAGIV